MTHTPYPGLWPPLNSHRGAPRLSAPVPPQLPAAWLRQYQFCLMRDRLHRHGGLLKLRQVQALVGVHAQPHPLANTGVLLEFPWMGEPWFPGFQFDAVHQRLRAELVALYAELPGSYDAWDTVHWFAVPNAFLHGVAPVALLRKDLQVVMAAARAEHFVVNG